MSASSNTFKKRSCSRRFSNMAEMNTTADMRLIWRPNLEELKFGFIVVPRLRRSDIRSFPRVEKCRYLLNKDFVL